MPGLRRAVAAQAGPRRQVRTIACKHVVFLDDGFVHDCLDREAKRLDMADPRRWGHQRFSGTLCVDEMHLGRTTLLLATDPLQDMPVAFTLVAGNVKGHMRRFLKNLGTWGLVPEVVVTDGSNLYPAILAELWPPAIS